MRECLRAFAICVNKLTFLPLRNLITIRLYTSNIKIISNPLNEQTNKYHHQPIILRGETVYKVY